MAEKLRSVFSAPGDALALFERRFSIRNFFVVFAQLAQLQVPREITTVAPLRG